MNRARPPLRIRGLVFSCGVGLFAALVMLTTVSVRSAQDPAPARNTEAFPSPAAVNNQAAMASPKEKEEPKKPGLDKTKADAAELSALADQLRDELSKTNINVFPLDVLEKTQKVEKLAKKIKGEATKD
jgi:hypothetical protein